MQLLIKWPVAILLFLTAPLWLPILLVLKLFGKPAVVEPTEVEDWLQRMHSGEVDQYWWDDFLSIPIRDPELDSIRERCEHIWSIDSGYLERVDADTFRLNEKGILEIEKLIRKCRSVRCKSQASEA